jgi:RND family efflux transporter MFP subunit
MLPANKIAPIFLTLVAALVLSGCALLPSGGLADRAAAEEPTPTPIPTPVVAVKPTYKVQRGEIVHELEFSGRISPVNEEDLFFRASGRVRAVFKKRNDFVTAGEIIAELEIDSLERQLEAAELELELAALQADAQPDTTAIAIQQKQVELAQLEVERLSQGVDPLLVSDVTRAELNVQKLKADIAEHQVIAPFDGQLLSVSLTPGQAVDAYKPVATLADVTELEVSADLISTQMQDLVEGMPASIILVSRPGVELTGSIRRLPYPYGSGGRGTTVEDLDKSTRITLDQSAAEASYELGDLVRVRVELERKADVLWLPPQALRVFDGRRFAVIQDGDVQRRVDVTVGIETPERVEIEAGLEEGQVVIGQ